MNSVPFSGQLTRTRAKPMEMPSADGPFANALNRDLMNNNTTVVVTDEERSGAPLALIRPKPATTIESAARLLAQLTRREGHALDGYRVQRALDEHMRIVPEIEDDWLMVRRNSISSGSNWSRLRLANESVPSSPSSASSGLHITVIIAFVSMVIYLLLIAN